MEKFFKIRNLGEIPRFLHQGVEIFERECISLKANIDAKNKNGDTPLHIAL